MLQETALGVSQLLDSHCSSDGKKGFGSGDLVVVCA
jgi:hypothetical protein